MSIKSYNEYIGVVNGNLDKLDEIRRQLIAQCKQLYQRVQSALEYTDADYDEYDIDRYVLEPESYDWFEEIGDEEADRAYRLYEKAYLLSNDVSDILDAIDDVKYYIEKCESDLSWVEGD